MEVFASLKSSGIYLSGDTVKCQVTFLNTQEINTQAYEAIEEKIEHLAWASVQLQCICQVANSGPSRRESESLTSLDSATTSLQPQKDAFTREVFATKPKILFCDLFLEPSESKSFEFEDVIPLSAPNSYNGRGLKYAYRVIIASQRLNRPIGTLKIPFRVLSVKSGNLDAQPDHQTGGGDQIQPQVNPSITNPFYTSESKESQDNSVCISNHLSEPSARRVATFYDIKNSKGRVGRLCLFKTSFRLGEVMGLFDFSQCESQCMQYSVSLFCEEEVKTGVSFKPKVLWKQSVQEFSFGYDESNFTLTIPLHGTPSFNDENCVLSWMLRFEFVIAAASSNVIPKQPLLDENCTEGHEWNGPANCEVETMTWNLPIKVCPTNPKYVANVVHMQTEFSLVI